MNGGRLTIEAGKFYQDRWGDVHGPMDQRAPNCFLDQHGAVYQPDGRQWNHLSESMSTLSQERNEGDLRERIARAVCIARGINPDCMHQNYGDEPVDSTDAQGRTYHFGWRNQLHIVDAVTPFVLAPLAQQEGRE